MLENIIIGVISGIISTLLTNCVSQYFAEKQIIGKSQRRITDFLESIGSKSNAEIHEMYCNMKDEIRELTLSVHILHKKTDRVLIGLSKLEDESRNDMNINDFRKGLEKLRDSL